ncbi:hypothetical protein MPSEU_000749800 [Mayamaea pseudoterrestris]|nr:hypothetical protein MPSEU_000749800 [Mayamaea pseudoterrestris]
MKESHFLSRSVHNHNLSSSSSNDNNESVLSVAIKRLLASPFALAILLTMSLVIAGYYQAETIHQQQEYANDSQENTDSLSNLFSAAGLSVTLIHSHSKASDSFMKIPKGVHVMTAASHGESHLNNHCPLARERYQELTMLLQNEVANGASSSKAVVATQLQHELVKYCSIKSILLNEQQQQPQRTNYNQKHQQLAIYMDTSDSSSAQWLIDLEDLLQLMFANAAKQDAISTMNSIVIAADPRYHSNAIHAGSLLVLHESHALIPQEMLTFLSETPLSKLLQHPHLVGRRLNELLSAATMQSNGNNQPSNLIFWQQTCHFGVINASACQSYASCPDSYPYCCSVLEPSSKQVVLLQKHPMIPYTPELKQTDIDKLPVPYNLQALATFSSPVTAINVDDMAYLATIGEHSNPKPTQQLPIPKNLFDILRDTKRLPTASCLQCMHLKKCPVKDMYKRCVDYFETLCTTPVPEKFVSKQWTVSLPRQSRDMTRLIPRIVHQTWYETLDKEDYPNMSRLQESFRQSGWEYRFYTDEDAVAFLATHFPPEVLEVYKKLIPGAFKADLFRYCALLIHGGVYADVDILLESNLDYAVAPDVGFMVPMDQPDACVWQGFIAAAPGHSFLAQAIETVVNQVRNRYTSIDLDASFCNEAAPLQHVDDSSDSIKGNINYKVLHMFDVLFTAGPCLLGASMNRVLGRHGQQPWEPGNVKSIGDESNNHYIPGRTVILKQNKWDMAGHRFTLVEENLIVAATDLENSDDRANAKLAAELKKQELDEKEDEDVDEDGSVDEEGTDDESEEKDEPKEEMTQVAEEATAVKKQGGEHYSKAHAKTGIYGQVGLYVDQVRANEEVRIFVDHLALPATWDGSTHNVRVQ